MLNIYLDASQPIDIAQVKILCLVLYTTFLKWLFGSLESNFLSPLYILDIGPLWDVGLVKIFSKFVGCCFVLLTVSFVLQKLCNFLRSHFTILDLKA